MKSFNEKIFEERFTGFSDLELKAFDQELQWWKQLYEEDEAFKAACKSVKNSMEEDYWTGEIEVPEIKYGNKYIVGFNNPFKEGKLTRIKDYHTYDAPDDLSNDSEDDFIFCFGIGDKFKNVHLINVWENGKVKIFYQDKKIKLKSGKEIKKRGFYLIRKDFPTYNILHKNKYDMYYGCKTLNKNTEVKLDNIFIVDIPRLKAEIEKAQEKIDDDWERFYAKRKEYIRQEKAAEASRKWWDARKDYEYFGCANGWDKVPPLVKKAFNDEHAVWHKIDQGMCQHLYICDTYKFTYTTDSSD